MCNKRTTDVMNEEEIFRPKDQKTANFQIFKIYFELKKFLCMTE